jgi:hypothetical protein
VASPQRRVKLREIGAISGMALVDHSASEGASTNPAVRLAQYPVRPTSQAVREPALRCRLGHPLSIVCP